MGIKDQLDKSGVVLVAIGSGTPQQAQKFSDKFKFNGELYVNQDLSAYKAFHLERGFWLTLGPRSLWKGVGALMHGFYQGLSAGDLWQQGGVFVMGPGKQMVFGHHERFAGDHADLQEVIQAGLSGKKEEATVVPLPPEEEWWIGIKGKQNGPFKTSKIEELLSSGKITKDAYIWKKGMNDWKRILEIECFQKI